MPKKNRTLLIANIKESTLQLSKELEKIVRSKSFPKNIFVYNPLEYAQGALFKYFETYINSPLDALFLGMNPGPNGMMQTGIPFGDVHYVKNYLGISTGVEKPRIEHPKRPILGFNCPKSEVSGTRLWSLFEAHHKNSKSFFQKFFVLNYCPLGFLTETGANLTPDKIDITLRKEIEALCDAYLLEIIPPLEAKNLVGIGAYAAKVFKRLFPSQNIITLLHPSPASPTANLGWPKVPTQQLKAAALI